MADLNDNVAKQALQPLSSAAGPQSVTGRSVSELIMAAQFDAAVKAARLIHQGLRFSTFTTQGASPIAAIPLDFGRGGIG